MPDRRDTIASGRSDRRGENGRDDAVGDMPMAAPWRTDELIPSVESRMPQ